MYMITPVIKVNEFPLWDQKPHFTISQWGDNISTVEEYLQYCEGITAVHVEGSFSTVGDTFSTVEGIQYSGEKCLISACLTIKNDEKIPIFFVLRNKIFVRKFRKF